ncbi:MAG: complex I NDUFA9 subunit family protein [Pseudomonadota bacterium]
MTKRAGSPKTIVLFGGAGFIGRYIVREAAKRGWQINIASRDPNAALYLKTSGSVGQIAPVFANIADDDSVRAAMRGADYVVNLCGILYETGRQKFDGVHRDGADRVARIAAEMGVQRLVHISAIGASSTSPATYAKTKAAGEQAVRNQMSDATILRPSIVFGPEDGFFNLFAGLARLAPFLPLIGGGHTRFQPVYACDVASAVMAVLDNNETAGKLYELGGPRTYTFKQLLQLILSEVGIKRPLIALPWSLAMVKATFLGLLPKPLLTRDQVKLLKADNVVAEDALGFKELNIEPTAVEVIVPTYLRRFRPGGRFAPKAA